MAFLILKIFCLALLTSRYFAVQGIGLRLVGGRHNLEGRVEILSPYPGTICDDGWGKESAKVVCKMLGLPFSRAVETKRAYFGGGTGNISLSNVACTGSESDISDCPRNSWGIHSCSHSEDAGVICGPPHSNDVKATFPCHSCPRVPDCICPKPPDCIASCPNLTCPALPELPYPPVDFDWNQMKTLSSFLQDYKNRTELVALRGAESSLKNGTFFIAKIVAACLVSLLIGSGMGGITVVACQYRRRSNHCESIRHASSQQRSVNNYHEGTGHQTTIAAPDSKENVLSEYASGSDSGPPCQPKLDGIYENFSKPGYELYANV